MKPAVSLQNVIKDYPLGKVTVRALHGVSLDIKPGEFTAIAGPSGSGKTTILNMIGCMDVPTSGSVAIDGTETSQLSDAQLTRLRLDRIGFIFQSFNLINVLDVRQNVEFPLLLQGKHSAKERAERVSRMVERVGLAKHARQRPNELSGGQRQRVAIARALVTNPAIVLADEPTANLDSHTGHEIIELMREMNEKDHTTFIFSTHDPQVMECAHRVVKVADGVLA
ncbi:MAG: ABC transporter ATP-binding protein [Deltaproteobacteria bacterium]|nr:ABC transporter ATP-binding protein [Deltaproteobacteria bacterium]